MLEHSTSEVGWRWRCQFRCRAEVSTSHLQNCRFERFVHPEDTDSASSNAEVARWWRLEGISGPSETKQLERRPAVIFSVLNYNRLEFGVAFHYGEFYQGILNTLYKSDPLHLSKDINATVELLKFTEIYQKDIILSQEFHEKLSGDVSSVVKTF